MAGVVVDAQALGQAIVAGPVILELPIKPDHLLTRFQVTQRFRFEAEVQILATLFAERIDVLNDFPKIAAHGPGLLVGGDELLERTRHGADATARIRRGKLGQNIEQSLGVFHALGSRPVRPVNLLLDAFRMKILEWESVDGVEVQVEVTQMISDRLCDSFSRELPGEALADVGSDGKGFAGTHPVSNRNHEVIDGGSEITHRRSGVSVHLVTEGVTSCALGDEHGGYGAPVLDMTLPETPSMVL